MRVYPCVLLLGAAALAPSALAQSTGDSLEIYTEHPRLFLRPQRLRLLRRERERRTTRWLQLETLMAGKAVMPEPGFAAALYYQIGGDREFANQAIRWALGPATDLRQLALVFDWCQDALTEAQSKSLAAKLAKSIAVSERDVSAAAARDRALAAVALAGHLPDVSKRQMEWIVNSWWNDRIVAGIKAGREEIPRESFYPLFEILHAVRDNTNLDLRDSAPAFFKGLPIFDLISYYPASFAAAESEYRIPAVKGAREPDLAVAAMSRAAELSMVAYDNNAQESQILQGWLMHDNFMMRGTFGVTYEFLWANPYQPGLSYYLVPLVFHDDLFGRLFIRSSWEEDAKWLAYFGGELQVFDDGKPTVLNPKLSFDPIRLPEAIVMPGNSAAKFKITMEEGESLFIISLKPRHIYEIEVDDEEMREESTDAGGILALQLPAKVPIGVRLREAPNRSLTQAKVRPGE
jgi:hypothetical protein